MTKRNFTSVNEHTGSVMVTKPSSKAYESGWENIWKQHVNCNFCKKEITEEKPTLFDAQWYHSGCLDEKYMEDSYKAEGL